jgi:hypothetical protein
MTGKMKRKELYDIQDQLQKVKMSGRTFTFIIADNKKRISDAIGEMEKQKEPSKEFKDHLQEVEKLKKQFSLKDHIGRPAMKPGNYPNGQPGMFYTIPGSEDPESEFRKVLKTHEIENKDSILGQEEKEKNYWDVYLEQDLEKEFEFRKVKYSEVPKEIPQDQMDACFFIIDYDVNAKGDVR